MGKRIFLLLLVIFLAAASLIIYYRSSFYDILKVKTPSCFVIDFNRNNSPDAGEEVNLPDIKVLYDENDGLNEEERFIFSELAKNYAEDFLFNKKVRYKNQVLYVDGKTYAEIFNNSGFNSRTAPEKYKEIIDYIRGHEFYIVNLHNLKAHKYACKFSQKTENYKLFEKSTLPEKTTFCKVCLDKPVKIQVSVPPQTTAVYGNIKIFYTDFTKKLKPDTSCSSTVCQELFSRINNAQTSIDMAVYGYRKVPQLEAAIAAAQKRGVKIRMVYDLDKAGGSIYEDTVRLAEVIPDSVSDKEAQKSVKTSYGNVIMHNKFYIFDNKSVFTGSANLSPSDMSGYNTNTAVVIDSPVIAEIYKREFEQMYDNKFHTQKSQTTDNTNINLGGSSVSVFFSPQDNITNEQILPLIRNAKKYIYIPAFLIMDKFMADELINAKKRGVDVKIILDALNAHSKYSQIKYLRAGGVEVKAENYAGKLHCKTILIDDEITVIGSMNFSKSGQIYNDENVLVIKNHDITSAYREFFEYLWARIDDWWLMYIPRTEGWESIGSCADGVDNNYDGLTDAEDAGCRN